MVWCLLLARPFLVIIVWAIIIAVSIYPLHHKLVKLYKGRRGLAESTFLAVGLAAIILPLIKFARSIVTHTNQISAFITDPEAQFPSPNATVREWPMIGSTVYEAWTNAYSNLEEFISAHSEVVPKVIGWLIKGLGTMLADVMVSLISFVVAGFFLYNSKIMHDGVLRFADRLLGDKGEKYVVVARDTIKSVVQGIILIAVIQAVLSYIGFAIIGIKSAALFAIIIMILAVIQLPVILVTFPVAVYVFSITCTTSAIV